MLKIAVTDIKKGQPGLTPLAASQLYEAFEVCMHNCEHPEIVSLLMLGDRNNDNRSDNNRCDDIILLWRDEYTEQMGRTYADMQYAVEHGAICLSIMLTTTLTPYKVVERSRKGTGIDYWLGDEETFLFQKKARLEVSGILEGDETAVKHRHAVKVEQTRRSDYIQLPAYISIVEFSTPKAWFAQRIVKWK